MDTRHHKQNRQRIRNTKFSHITTNTTDILCNSVRNRDALEPLNQLSTDVSSIELRDGQSQSQSKYQNIQLCGSTFPFIDIETLYTQLKSLTDQRKGTILHESLIKQHHSQEQVLIKICHAPHKSLFGRLE